MHKKLDLLYKKNLDKNIDLFKQCQFNKNLENYGENISTSNKSLKSNKNSQNVKYHKTFFNEGSKNENKYVSSYNQNQNQYQKYTNINNNNINNSNSNYINNKENIQPCNFYTSAYKPYFIDNYNTNNNRQIYNINKSNNFTNTFHINSAYLKNSTQQQQQQNFKNQFKENINNKRRSSIQKKNSNCSKQLSLNNDATPTFSLIEDPPLQPKVNKKQNRINKNSFNLNNTKTASNKYINSQNAQKPVKHQRHNSQGFQNNKKKQRQMRFTVQTNLNNNFQSFQTKYQKYVPQQQQFFANKSRQINNNKQNNRQNYNEDNQISINDLRARLDRQLIKNQELNSKCKDLLNKNKQLKTMNQYHKNTELLKQNHQMQDQLQKWRKIINHNSSADNNHYKNPKRLVIDSQDNFWYPKLQEK